MLRRYRMSRPYRDVPVGWLLCSFLMLLFGILLPAPSSGADRLAEAGIQGGVDVDSDEDFVQVEAYGIVGLPWSWSMRTLRLTPILNGTIGVLDGGGDTGLIATIGPGIHLAFGDSGFSLAGGVNPTLLDEDEYGDVDFGGYFQFTSWIGLRYDVTRHLGVFGRLHHMSNADLYEPNPGLNVVSVGLGWRF